MSPHNSEPVGYLSLTQDRTGLIHLLSSINHYEFNVAWIRQGQPEGSPDPSPQTLTRKEVCQPRRSAQAADSRSKQRVVLSPSMPMPRPVPDS